MFWVIQPQLNGLEISLQKFKAELNFMKLIPPAQSSSWISGLINWIEMLIDLIQTEDIQFD